MWIAPWCSTNREQHRATTPRSLVKLPPDLTQETYTLLPYAENIYIVLLLFIYWALSVSTALGKLAQSGQIYQTSVLLQWDVLMWCLPSSLYCGTITQPNTTVSLPLQRISWWESGSLPALGGVSRPCRPSLPIDHPPPTHLGHAKG